MRLALRFWKYLLLWTGILLVLLLAVTTVAGSGPREVLVGLPVWLGLALALAAYPAGVAVADDTLPAGRLDIRRIVSVGLAAAAVSVLMLTLGNVAGPRLARALAVHGPATGVTEPAYLTYTELKAAARAAVEAAEARPGPPTAEGWREANTLAWYFIRRTDGTALPLLFAMVGVLCGLWAGRTRRRDLRRTQLWAMGLFLVMSTYLAGENSFELIAARTAGPAFFASDFVLVVPCLLIIGIGWPTVVTALTSPPTVHDSARDKLA